MYTDTHRIKNNKTVFKIYFYKDGRNKDRCSGAFLQSQVWEAETRGSQVVGHPGLQSKTLSQNKADITQ